MIPSLSALKKAIDLAKQNEGLDLAVRIDSDNVEHWRVVDREKRALGMEKPNRLAAWESYLFGKGGE